MKITIKITADNAAFEDCAGTEVARILRNLADKVETTALDNDYDNHLVLHDLNGNKVGYFDVSDS